MYSVLLRRWRELVTASRAAAPLRSLDDKLSRQGETPPLGRTGPLQHHPQSAAVSAFHQFAVAHEKSGQSVVMYDVASPAFKSGCMFR